jgi:hypothetical protein
MNDSPGQGPVCNKLDCWDIRSLAEQGLKGPFAVTALDPVGGAFALGFIHDVTAEDPSRGRSCQRV